MMISPRSTYTAWICFSRRSCCSHRTRPALSIQTRRSLFAWGQYLCSSFAGSSCTSRKADTALRSVLRKEVSFLHRYRDPGFHRRLYRGMRAILYGCVRQIEGRRPFPCCKGPPCWQLDRTHEIPEHDPRSLIPEYEARGHHETCSSETICTCKWDNTLSRGVSVVFVGNTITNQHKILRDSMAQKRQRL
jgi:hypothetical protein